MPGVMNECQDGSVGHLLMNEHAGSMFCLKEDWLYIFGQLSMFKYVGVCMGLGFQMNENEYLSCDPSQVINAIHGVFKKGHFFQYIYH